MKSEFSANLRKLRVQNKLTQKNVADMINLSQRAYAFYETGEREPNLETLVRIAELYRVPLDALVGRKYIDNNNTFNFNNSLNNNPNSTITISQNF